MLELVATDLKQHAYCPRIPYYRYVMPVVVPPTYKMARGRDVEGAVEALERRRGFARYGVGADAQRLFGVWVRSERLGLSGKLDLLVKTAEACYPVDFKDTEGGVRRNHRMQMAAYACLAQEHFGLPVPACFLYLVPEKELVAVPVSAADLEEVVRLLGEIRRSIEREVMPGPTPVTARCAACEYRNFCADVW